jgi:hypothetical protein
MILTLPTDGRASAYGQRLFTRCSAEHNASGSALRWEQYRDVSLSTNLLRATVSCVVIVQSHNEEGLRDSKDRAAWQLNWVPCEEATGPSLSMNNI